MKTTYGITQLLNKIGWVDIQPISPQKAYINSFKSFETEPDKYQEPNLSVQGLDCVNQPKLVLISAAGAVGKSTLTEYLSAKTGMPVLDLALNKPVGDCTLTGILAEVYDFSEVKRAIESGNQGILIDALDEGYMKVSDEAFFSFIDDLLKYTNGTAQSTPFILLGRTNIIQIVKDELFRRKLEILHLKIDPFTENQAKEFLYRHIIGEEKGKYQSPYKETVDYLIKSIQGFFKSQGQIDQTTYENFIGYAPVLLAIVELLSGQNKENATTNFIAILNDLKKQNSKNVQLLIDLIEKILDREHQKVQNQLIKLISTKYSEHIQEEAKRCYSIEEQCVRLMTWSFGFEESICDIPDENFKLKYEEGLKSFFEEHPFLTNGGLNNVVFESYVLATVAASEKYAFLAEDYLNNGKFKTSFALYPIMTKIIRDKNLIPPQSFFAPIYGSLTSQSPELLMTEVDISEAEGDRVTVSFKNENLNIDDEIEFKTGSSNEFNIGDYIGNSTISGGFNILFSAQHLHICAPMKMECEVIKLASSDLTLTKGTSSDQSIVIVCEKMDIENKDGGIVEIKNPDDIKPIIYCPVKPSYPISLFHKEEPYKKDDPNYEKYQKLRGIIQQFRAHGKGRGNWAKKRDKIYRRYAYGVGRDTLNALLNAGILYVDRHLYKMNTEKLRDKLHLTYDEMLNGTINDSVNKFLNSY